MSQKISQLIQRTPNGEEFLEVIIPPFTAGTNRKVLLSDILAMAGGGGAVDSVNGQTGVVVLDAGDVGADPSGSAAAVDADLDAHIADATAAHAASAISNTPAGNIAATTVQAAINELDGDKVDKESWTTLTDGSTVTWNVDNKQFPLGVLTSTQSFTLAFSGTVKDGSSGVLKIITNTALAITITFPSAGGMTHRAFNFVFTTYTLPALTAQQYVLSYIVNGTVLEWRLADNTSVAPYAHVARAASQSTTSGSTTPFTFDTEYYDNSSIWTVSPNPTRLVVPGTGKKIAHINGWVNFANNGATLTGYRRAFGYRNGVYTASEGLFAQTYQIQSTQDPVLTIAWQAECNGGDYFEITPVQNSATLNVTCNIHISFRDA